MADSTIISASLSDKDIKESIDKLVKHVDEGMNKMVASTNSAVAKMRESIKSLGDLKIDFGGSASSNVVSKLKNDSKEISATLDQTAQALKRAASGNTILETYDIQTQLLIERLKEVRADIDIFNAAIGSGKATQIEWGQQGLRQANAEAEKLMSAISNLESKRDALSNIMRPQTNDIKNYVENLTRINPELQLLNQQYKNGTALLQQKNLVLRRSAQEEQQTAQESAVAQQKLANYVSQSASRQEELRQEIIKTGLAAQQEAKKSMEAINAQMASGNGMQVPADKIYELLGLFKQINTAYYTEGADRESPMHKSLMNDMVAIREVIKEVSKYNNAIFMDNLSGGVGVTQRSTVESLRKEISALTNEYNKLTIAQINAGKADELIKNFQNANRAAQVLQKTLSRPIDLKSAMGLQANTLDEIAYKMQMLRAYRENLNIFDPKQKNEIEQVNAALKDLEKTQREVMGENESMLKSNNALARSFNYMKNRLAFYFTVGAATQFIKQLIDIRSQYEMNERALGILIDSAEKGSQIFNELSQMSLVSPYTLIELTNAAKQFTAYGVAARDVVDTTRRLADIAAAVGAPIERISYALGHIQTYGYLTSLQARQFANNGIPLVKELAARYSELEGRLVTTADVYDRMKKKQVEYADVMDVINRMTDEGGRFFDFQAKMADTLKVRLANLNLAWNNMLNDMGKSSQGLLTWTIGSLRTLFTHWKQLDQAIKSAAWAGGLIVAIRALNVLLVKAGANFGILSASMTTTQIAGKGLASTLGNVIGGFKALVTTPLTWWSLFAFAIVDAWRDLKNLNEAQKEFNKSLRDAGNNNTKSLTDFYNQYNGGARKISADDAIKVWEEMREQIELTVKKSDMFVGSLLRIDDVSKRLKVGFELINDINEVNAALKELDDDSIKMEADFSKWWNLNLWPDGLVENIQNYTKAQKELYEYSMKGESLSKMVEDAKELEEKFLDLQGAISITTGSINDLIKLKGWEGNINKINALYDQVFGNLAEKYNLSPSEAFNMQMAAEKSRSIATEKALQIRLADERAALKAATDETTRYAITQKLSELEQEFFFFVKNTDKSRVYWRDFTNWIKTNHLSETQAMFKGMDAQQVRSLDFEKGKYFEWVDTLTRQYAKEHKISYEETFDMLKNYITNANQMSIFIPLVIGGENKKSVYQTLTEADQAADTAWQKIERLNTRIAELSKNKASNTEQLTDAQAELTQAYQDYNDAIAKGGHSKKETTKATKDQKAAESELQKALKEEIQLLDKARSVYKQLTKEGLASNEALTIATEGYEETITHINSVLQKYGIQKFNLAAYAGVQSPHAIMELLQGQLDALVKSGVAKPEEIKELKMKLKDVKVDEVSFNQKTLTDSLNNELNKLKDEYELAVELDANPELGDLFSSLFGIVPEQLPHSFVEYADKVKDALNRAFEQRKESTRLESMFFSKDDLNAYKEVLGEKSFEDLKNAYDTLTRIRKDAINDVSKMTNEYISKYGSLDAQLRKIENDRNNAIKQLDTVYYTEKMKQSQAYFDALKAIEEMYLRNTANAVFENLKKTDDFDRFFNAIDTLTMSEAKEIKARIQKAITESFKNGGMTITQFRRELSNLQQQFDKLGKSSTLFTSFLKGGFDGLIKRAKELGNELTVIGENINKSGVVDEKDKSFLSSLGKIFDVGGGKLGDFTQLLNKYGSNVQGLGNAVSQAGQGMQGAASSFAGAVGIVDTIIKNIHGAIVGINEIMDVLNQGRNEESKVGGKVWDAITAFDKYAASGWEKLKSGNVLGAIADTALSIIAPIVSIFQAQNRAITRKIEESERQVRKLENAYKDLEFTAENAYGAIASGANRATIENKKLQLAEAKRQLELEQSRRAKYRDQDKIIEYQGKIEDLENEIAKAANDITNELLGISSAGEGITQLVDTMIEAFKNGENAMDAFGESWDKMIDNMIAKLLVSTFMQREWDNLMNIINEKEEEFTGQAAKNKAEASKFLSDIEGLSDEELENYVKRVLANQWWNGEYKWDYVRVGDDVMKKLINSMVESYKRQFESASDELDSASIDWTQWAIDYMSTTGRDTLLKQAEMLNEALGDWFTFGENNAAQLSNLQQGISSITEETANAIEGYLNGVSQQVYLHSELLTQIRDAIVGANFDVQLDVQSQMLLQLQNGYQTMNAMRTMMENWQTPSGNGIRVEML